MRSLPLGTVGVEGEADERGECAIWLEEKGLNRLGAMRGPARAIATSFCGWRRNEGAGAALATGGRSDRWPCHSRHSIASANPHQARSGEFRRAYGPAAPTESGVRYNEQRRSKLIARKRDRHAPSYSRTICILSSS
jgi:hypothetical protein